MYISLAKMESGRMGKKQGKTRRRLTENVLYVGNDTTFFANC